MLDPEEHAAQQHRLTAIPVLDGNLLERSDRAADTSVVPHDIEASKFLDRARNERLDFAFRGDISLLKNRAPAVLLTFANRRLSTLDVQIRNDNRATFTSQPSRRR